MSSMEGNGTEKDPFRISCFEELQAVKENLSAHYKLANDIDASNSKPEEFEPIGDEINPFTGTFDGNNYEIRNVCIKQPEEDYVGLFGYIGRNGQVRNLVLISPSIEGKNDVGSFSGHNRGEIVCSYIKGGHISGGIDIGGLVGWNDGKIESSYLVESDVSGDKVVGGIVGWNYKIERVESSFILSSADNTNILENTDIVLTRGNHTISYVVETKTLYVQIDNEIYSSGDVSPVEVQSLLEDTQVVKITEKFMTSVVVATQD